MDSDEVRYSGGYTPGDTVTVIDGTFKGMPGVVVGPDEARVLHAQAGGEDSLLARPPGLVWVVLNIFGRSVPISLQSSQIEERPV
jgi:transcription antitermination factor NusG